MTALCINCELADLRPRRVQLPGSMRGKEYTVEMQGLQCPNCGYKTIEGKAMPEFGRLLADRWRAENNMLTSGEIRARRKALGMSQEEFAAFLGVGVASIKRWELGKIQERIYDELIREKTRQLPEPVLYFDPNIFVSHASTVNCTLIGSVNMLERGSVFGVEFRPEKDFEDYIDVVIGQVRCQRCNATAEQFKGKDPVFEGSGTISAHLADRMLRGHHARR